MPIGERALINRAAAGKPPYIQLQWWPGDVCEPPTRAEHDAPGWRLIAAASRRELAGAEATPFRSKRSGTVTMHDSLLRARIHACQPNNTVSASVLRLDALSVARWLPSGTRCRSAPFSPPGVKWRPPSARSAY